MSDAGREIAYCHACGAAMDVSQVAPFTNVACPNCGKHTRVKREFGHYTLIRRHALGGMSVVFVARDNELDREVALKILSETFSADEKRIAAFKQEARLTAAISHPHVVRLFTTGRAFGRFYIAMEFVPGGHYERRIRDGGSLPEKETLDVALQVADGLRAAYASGLIHRDIKPGNILFDEQGHAKIVDFGLALVLQGGSAKADELWATTYYVPPEAIEGRDEDFRSDIYAFGATFYHALAGKPPCSEESMSTPKLRAAKRKIVPLDQAAPWLGLETCAVIDKAMAYEPEARFQSYEDLIAALEVAMRHAKLGAGRQEMPAVGRGRRRETAQAGGKSGVVIAVLVFVAVVGLGGWWLLRYNSEDGAASVAPTANGTQNRTRKANPADVARVGAAYQAARKALADGQYPEAEDRFGKLLDDPGVPEPTATSCGVESAIAALLDGRSSEARRRVFKVASHVAERAPRVDSEMRLLGTAAQEFGDLGPIPPEDGGLQSSGEILRAMLFGLKDWEQGCMEDGAGWLRKVAEVPESNDWAAVYRDLAASYLADFILLGANDFDTPPETPDACRRLESQLEEACGKLRTKGRAVFNLRTRLDILARHASTLENVAPAHKPNPPALAFDKLLPDVRKLNSAARFADARKRLASFEPSDSAELIRRNAWLYLVGGAADFFREISKDVANGIHVELKTRAGKSYDRVAGLAPNGGLFLAAASAPPVAVAWGDLDPHSVIELHKLLVNRESDSAVRLRRHEHAIAYDFLVVDRQHAEAAAERLAESSPEFRKRWAGAMHSINL